MSPSGGSGGRFAPIMPLPFFQEGGGVSPVYSPGAAAAFRRLGQMREIAALESQMRQMQGLEGGGYGRGVGGDTSTLNPTFNDPPPLFGSPM